MCHITVLMICREEIYEYDYGGGDRGPVNIFIIRSIPRLVISRNPQSTIIMSLVMDYFIITAFTDWHSVEGFLQFGVSISDGENMLKYVLIINKRLFTYFIFSSITAPMSKLRSPICLVLGIQYPVNVVWLLWRSAGQWDYSLPFYIVNTGSSAWPPLAALACSHALT